MKRLILFTYGTEAPLIFEYSSVNHDTIEGILAIQSVEVTSSGLGYPNRIWACFGVKWGFNTVD